MATQPRCPFCNAHGVDQIAAHKLGVAVVLYCSHCGAIHGVVPGSSSRPKPVSVSAATSTPTQTAPPPQPSATVTEPKTAKAKIRPPKVPGMGGQPAPVSEPRFDDETPPSPQNIPRDEPVRKVYAAPGPDPLPRVQADPNHQENTLPRQEVDPYDHETLTPEQAARMMYFDAHRYQR